MPCSHALDDVASVLSFDDEDVDGIDLSISNNQQQLAAAAARLTTAAPPRTGKPYHDVPLPPPERPLKWQTKLADRATAAVSLEARYNVPPHLLFELLADPTQHVSIFDEILAADAELLEEEGPRRKWRLDYTARWQFWKVKGVCENRLLMWTDSDAGTVTFKLREPGFLKRYEGTWTIKAGCGSSLADFNNTATSAHCAGAAAYDLVSTTSNSNSSSRGSSPASSPRSSWAAGAPSVDMFCGGSSSSSGSLSRGGSGASSNGSSISLRSLPLATVTAAAAPAGLPQTVSQGVSTAAATLGSSISSGLWNWLGYGRNSSTQSQSAAPGGPAADANSNSAHQWPPLFKSSSASASSQGGPPAPASSATGSLSPEAATAPEQLLRRPAPESAVITASTLTSPKLTPPYPLNQALKVQSKGQVEEMLEGLVRAATARLIAQPLQGL